MCFHQKKPLFGIWTIRFIALRLILPISLMTPRMKWTTPSSRTSNFFHQYGITPEALSTAYHQRIPVEMIVPYENLAEKLQRVPFEQYVFTASNREGSTRILKHIGLWEMFQNRFFSVEDFGVTKKNENAELYRRYCAKINQNPEDCIFVDDSYSNLEFAKQVGMTTVRIYYRDNSAKDKTYIDAAFKGVEACIDALARCA